MARVGELYDKVTNINAINRVRTLHHIVNISYISSADGRRLNPMHLKKGACLAIRSTSVWPHKHHVIPDDYTAYMKFLRLVFPTHDYRFEVSLNKWVIPEESWLTS